MQMYIDRASAYTKIYKAKTARSPNRPAPAKRADFESAAPVCWGLAPDPLAEPDAISNVRVQKLGSRNEELTTRSTSRASSSRGTTRGSRSAGTSSTESSLAAREKAGNAALDTIGVGGGSSCGAITLIALGSALVGVDSLGGIGASIA